LFLKSKLARRSAAGLSAVALMTALLAPTGAWAQSFKMHRCMGDPQCVPSTSVAVPQANVEVPIAATLSDQSAKAAAEASSDQFNKASQDAENKNTVVGADTLAQKQVSDQTAGDQSNELSNWQKQNSSADVVVKGGDTTAIGPNAVVNYDV